MNFRGRNFDSSGESDLLVGRLGYLPTAARVEFVFEMPLHRSSLSRHSRFLSSGVPWLRGPYLIVLLGACALARLCHGADVAQLADQNCQSCHGHQFVGARTPPLRGGTWRNAQNDADALRIIAEGIPSAGMPAFGEKIPAEDRAALVAYIHKTGSSANTAAPTRSAIVKTQRQKFRIEQVSSGYETPWSLAFLPEGKILVSERAGRLRIVDHGENSAPIRDVPKVWYRQDGGLLSLALDPDFAKNGWIYLSYSEPGSGWGWATTSMTKIVRGHIVNGAWTDQQTVWQADPRFYTRSTEHYGCRLLFVRGKLFFTIGDRGHRDNAQDLSNPCGKVHRVEPDGRIPTDNPFVGKGDAAPSIWSYGHRNPQGLAFNADTGELWETEHGPKGGDELNLLQPGKNYGWPVVTFGVADDGSVISELTTKPGMIDPLAHWTPSIAVSPVHLSLSDRYPGWKHMLLVGSLMMQEFRRIEVRDGQVVEQELLFKNRGRIRDIATGPDGYLYLALENWDRGGEIIRLVPIAN